MKDLSHLSAPPPHPVRWKVYEIARPINEATVMSQTWVTARELGAAALGLPVERVEARIDDVGGKA